MQAVSTAVDPKTTLLLRISIAWHSFLVVACLSGIFLLQTAPAISGWQHWLGSLIPLGMGIASAAAAVTIQRSSPRGRVISLAVNYLGFLFCLLYGLHVTGIFLGIDDLANTFGSGIIPLGGIVAGYLITTIGDRYDQYPAHQRAFQRAGKFVMAVFGLWFLLAVGLLQGLAAFFVRLLAPLPLALAAGTLLFAVMIWALWRYPSAVALHARSSDEEMLSGFLFLSPNLLGFLFFFAGPLLLSFYVSFTDWDAFGTRNWVGLANYAKLFNLSLASLQSPTQAASEAIDVSVYDEVTRVGVLGKYLILGAQDKLFWLALSNTLTFALLVVPLSVIPALLLANLLNSKLPGMKFFRAIYFLPSIAAVVGVALIWQWLYNAAVGYINYSITSTVELINTLFGAALIDPQIRWLSDTRTALLAVVIMSAWQWIGFNTVLFLAGLQGIPAELYEAATVDGAGRWNKFRHVTIPLLAPTTFFVITTAVIQALQLFEQVYVLIPTEPPGGPNNSTLSLVLYLYQKGFQRFEQGYASAVAWVLFLGIFTITLIQYFRQQGTEAA